MKIYEDLSYYSNDHFEYSLNVGWVSLKDKADNNYDYSTLLDRMTAYLDYPFNTVRDNSFVIGWKYKEVTYNLGYSEIRVISDDGQVYALPDTVFYSITSQGYKPPDEFINAVLNGCSVNSDIYKSYIKHYNNKDFWGATKKQKDDNLIVEQCFDSDNPSMLAEFLAKDKSNINAVTTEGSLLNKAIINKREKIAEWLLNNDFPIQNYSGLELLTAIKYNMNTIANILIDQNIYMPTHSFGKNPLFMAALHKNNEIAVRLFLEKPELRVKYSNEFVNDCDILKLCASCNNVEMLSFIRNNT